MEILEKADEIMEEAVKKAGELLCTSPKVAEIILKQLLRCDPEHLAGLQLLGLCEHRLGKHAEAIEIIQIALELDPDCADNWNNIGLAYAGLGNYKKAISCIEKSIELKPEQFLFKNNLSLQYRAIGDYEKSIIKMKEAIEVDPKPQLWVNLGGIYGETRDIEEAKKCFKKALELDKDYSPAYVDLAFAYHLQGDWQKGFAAYEWRFSYYPQMQYYLNSYDMSKKWDGEQNIKGKRVLIYGEQGLGDIIQFVRYTKKLKDLGAYVIVHCPDNIKKLIERIDGVDEVCTKDIVNLKKEESFPDYDLQFSMMSFPYLLKENTINGKPYIKKSKKLPVKQKYEKTFNVGIVWAGSPAHPHDKNRSIPLKYFKSLNIDKVKLFSLQLDLRARQYGISYSSLESANVVDVFDPNGEIIDYCDGCENIELVDCRKYMEDFDKTADLVSSLDLIVCCDTAISHLAGALGVPVWVCIPFNPDWRWTLNGTKTPWYDSMTLYRQKNRGNWQEVIDKITKDLKEIIDEKFL